MNQISFYKPISSTTSSDNYLQKETIFSGKTSAGEDIEVSFASTETKSKTKSDQAKAKNVLSEIFPEITNIVPFSKPQHSDSDFTLQDHTVTLSPSPKGSTTSESEQSNSSSRLSYEQRAQNTSFESQLSDLRAQYPSEKFNSAYTCYQGHVLSRTSAEDPNQGLGVNKHDKAISQQAEGNIKDFEKYLVPSSCFSPFTSICELPSGPEKNSLREQFLKTFGLDVKSKDLSICKPAILMQNFGNSLVLLNQYNDKIHSVTSPLYRQSGVKWSNDSEFLDTTRNQLVNSLIDDGKHAKNLLNNPSLSLSDDAKSILQEIDQRSNQILQSMPTISDINDYGSEKALIPYPFLGFP